MRLFIAVNFDDETKASLSTVIQELKSYAIKGSFTKKENLHLTVAFIGETSRCDVVKQVIDSITIEPFWLVIKGLGRFVRENGDIYWIGVDKSDRLSLIYNQLYSKLTKNGFAIEKRTFKPHLTLGRNVILNKNYDSSVFEKNITPMKIKVPKISLMKSERIDGKLIYSEIH